MRQSFRKRKFIGLVGGFQCTTMLREDGLHLGVNHRFEFIIGGFDFGQRHDLWELVIKLKINQVASGGPEDVGFRQVIGAPIFPEAIGSVGFEVAVEDVCGAFGNGGTAFKFDEVPAGRHVVCADEIGVWKIVCGC